MRDDILRILPNDKHNIVKSKAKKIYIADYSEATKKERGVELSEVEPIIKYVWLDNDSKLPIYFDGFKDNALPLANGDNSAQCEGVAFPTTCNENDWVLFIECKYAYDLKQATDTKNGYPYEMINQIKATVKYFREAGILNQNRIVSAIAAFPTLVGNFDSWFFITGIESPVEIMYKYKIRIRATNFATIIDSKFIKLGYS